MDYYGTPPTECLVLMVRKDGRTKWKILPSPDVDAQAWRLTVSQCDFRIICYHRHISKDKRIFAWIRRIKWSDLDGTSMCPLSLDGYKILPDGTFPEFPEIIESDGNQDMWRIDIGHFKFRVVAPEPPPRWSSWSDDDE